MIADLNACVERDRVAPAPGAEELVFLSEAGTPLDLHVTNRSLRRIAAKTRASLMVEGELPEEGLAALDGDAGGVFLALPRKLADSNGAVADERSLEAPFTIADAAQDDNQVLAPAAWTDVDESATQGVAPMPGHCAPGPGIREGQRLAASHGRTSDPVRAARRGDASPEPTTFGPASAWIARPVRRPYRRLFMPSVPARPWTPTRPLRWSRTRQVRP